MSIIEGKTKIHIFFEGGGGPYMKLGHNRIQLERHQLHNIHKVLHHQSYNQCVHKPKDQQNYSIQWEPDFQSQESLYLN